MKNCLAYLFILLTAFQSVWAMAESHQFAPLHDHPQEFSTQTAVLNLDPQTSQEHSNAVKCNHCCHCHQLNFIQAASSPIAIASHQLLADQYASTTPRSSSSPLFRPPKF